MTPENAVQTVDENAELIERVVMMGDLSKLTAEQRLSYYRAVCESKGLNPLTQPFQYLTLNGKLVLYAGKNAAEQIRRIDGISVTKLEPSQDETTFSVYAYGVTRDGRMDAALGSVSIIGLKGEALANAKMKAETKAKRRLTLSLSGLGFLDETEVGSIPGAERVDVDLTTGEIIPPQTEVKTLRQLAEAAADAAEGSQEAPGADVKAEVAVDTTEAEPEPLWASETPEQLTDEEFRGLVKVGKVSAAAVKDAAHRLYPDIKSSADLTDAQRGRLWIVLATENES